MSSISKSVSHFITALMVVSCSQQNIQGNEEKQFGGTAANGDARAQMSSFEGSSRGLRAEGYVGGALGENIDGLSSTVNTFSVKPSLTLPVGSPNIKLDLQYTGWVDPMFPAGLGTGWMSEWFGRLDVQAWHVSLVSGNGSQQVIEMPKFDGVGTEFRFKDGSRLEFIGRDVSDGSAWATSYKVTDSKGTVANYDLQLDPSWKNSDYDPSGVTTHFKFYVPSSFTDIYGNKTEIEYYKSSSTTYSPIPRMVKISRAKSGGGLVETDRVYFYLERDYTPLFSPPAIFNNTTNTDRIQNIRYAGPLSTSRTEIQSSWHTVGLLYHSTNPKQLKKVTVLDQSFSFEYQTAKPYLVTKVSYPSKGTLQYTYQDFFAVVLSDGGALCYTRLDNPMCKALATKTFTGIDGVSDQVTFKQVMYSQSGNSSYLYQGTVVTFPKLVSSGQASTLYLHEPYYLGTTIGTGGHSAQDMIGMLRITKSYDSPLTVSGYQVSSEPAPRFETKNGFVYKLLGRKGVFKAGKSEASAWGQFSAFDVSTQYKPGSNEQLSTVNIYRDLSRNQDNYPRAKGSTVLDYDQYGNKPMHLSLSTSSAVTVSPNLDCTRLSNVYFENGVMKVNNSVTSGLLYEWWPCTQDNLSYVSSASKVANKTTYQYLIDVSAKAAQYAEKNIMSLPKMVRTEASDGTLIGNQEFGYDHEVAYPSISGTPGDLGTTVLGRLTSVKQINPTDSTKSPTKFTVYYGLSSDGLTPAGSIAEEASLVSSGLYRRARYTYAPLSGTVGLPGVISRSYVVDYNGAAQLLSEATVNAWESPLTSKDENGNISRIEYDNKGRAIKSFGPQDTTISTNETIYKDTIESVTSPKRVTTIVRETGLGKELRSHAFIDGLGRTVVTHVEKPDGRLIKTKTKYLKNTRLPIEVHSSFDDATPSGGATAFQMPGDNHPFQTITYDDFGRPVKTEDRAAAGQGVTRTASTRYGDVSSGLTMLEVESTDVNGKVSKVKSDLLGRTILSTLPDGNTIASLYNDKGQLTKTTHPDNQVTTYGFDSLGRTNVVTSPEAGTEQVEYSIAGEVTKRTQANGSYQTYSYDYRGRLQTRSHNNAMVAGYVYDSYPANSLAINKSYPKGRLTRVLSLKDDGQAAGTEDYGYDQLGRNVDLNVSLNGLSPKKTEWMYDRLGNVIYMRYQGGLNASTPSEGFEIGYVYDSALRPTKVWLTDRDANNQPTLRQLSEITYDALSRVDTGKLLVTSSGSLQENKFYYDAWGRVTGLNDPSNLGSKAFAYRIGYESAAMAGLPGVVSRKDGVPSSIVWNTMGGSVGAYVYSYNDRNFLTNADFFTKSTPSSSTFINQTQYDMSATYNGVGSLLTMKQNTESAGAQSTTYSYAPNRRLNSTSGVTTRSFTYDTSGNQISNSVYGAGNQIVYNAANRVTQITMGALSSSVPGPRRVNYTYDANGMKIKSEDQDLVGSNYTTSSATYTVRIKGTPVAEYNAQGALQQINLSTIGFKIPSGSSAGEPGLYFNITDHLGSVRAVLKENGNIHLRKDYFPFGKEMAGRSQTYIDTNVKRQFATYERNTNLPGKDTHYAAARNYDDLGVFSRPDPLKNAFPGLTAYNYVGNIPTALTDSSGMSPDNNDPPTRVGFFKPGLHEQVMNAVYCSGCQLTSVGVEVKTDKKDPEPKSYHTPMTWIASKLSAIGHAIGGAFKSAWNAPMPGDFWLTGKGDFTNGFERGQISVGDWIQGGVLAVGDGKGGTKPLMGPLDLLPGGKGATTGLRLAGTTVRVEAAGTKIISMVDDIAESTQRVTDDIFALEGYTNIGVHSNAAGAVARTQTGPLMTLEEMVQEAFAHGLERGDKVCILGCEIGKSPETLLKIKELAGATEVVGYNHIIGPSRTRYQIVDDGIGYAFPVHDITVVH